MIPDSFLWASTCIFPTAKLGLAPGWHFPQVAGTFFGLTMESGSSGGRMSWMPWHEAQLATVREPKPLATPWNEFLYVATCSVSMPNLLMIVTEAWHVEHCSATWVAYTEDLGSRRPESVCQAGRPRHEAGSGM